MSNVNYIDETFNKVLQMYPVLKTAQIETIENLVATDYNIQIGDLSTFYRDSESKVMCCFLLHNLLDYSVHSVAKAYNINPGFLAKKMFLLLQDAQTDEALKQRIIKLRTAYNIIQNE